MHMLLEQIYSYSHFIEFMQQTCMKKVHENEHKTDNLQMIKRCNYS